MGISIGWARRVTYLIDPNGVIRTVYPRVRVRAHAREILLDMLEAKRAE